MVSRPQRTNVATRPDTVVLPSSARNRMAAWDQVAPSELAFDFTAKNAEPKPPGLDWGVKDRASVKEAIIRWLEEQL